MAEPTAPRFELPDERETAHDTRQDRFHEHFEYHRTHSLHSDAYKAKVMQRYRRNKATREREARQHESL